MTMSQKRRMSDRSGFAGRSRGVHELGGEALGAVAGGERIGQAGPGDALAAARQQFGQGQHQHQRARFLGNAGAGRFVEHGRRGVGPQPHRMGGFPFAVAHIGVVVAGRAAPVDARGIAFDIGPELPEILADAALAAAMPAGDHGVDDAARLDQQVGHQRGPQPATGERVARRYRSLDLADTRHQMPFTSFATTSRTLMPSARAAKVSAMRCCSTGSASARTSSIEGASRPS